MNDKQFCVLEVIFATKQQGLGLNKKDKIIILLANGQNFKNLFNAVMLFRGGLWQKPIVTRKFLVVNASLHWLNKVNCLDLSFSLITRGE